MDKDACELVARCSKPKSGWMKLPWCGCVRTHVRLCLCGVELGPRALCVLGKHAAPSCAPAQCDYQWRATNWDDKLCRHCL